MVEPINNVFHRKFLWLTQAIVTRQDTLRFCDFFFFFSSPDTKFALNFNPRLIILISVP